MNKIINSPRYRMLHYRVYKIFGKASLCQNNPSHTNRKYEWANISGEYKDVNDFIQLCQSCHRKKDWTIEQRQLWSKRFKNGKGTYHKKIKQYDKNGIFIREFESVNSAASYFGICKTGISNAIHKHGRTKSAAGYYWSL